MTASVRRRSFVDRFAISAHPPSHTLTTHLPDPLRPHVSIRQRLQDLLDEAFPPLNAPAADPPTVATFQRAIQALEAPLNILVSPLERGEPVDPQYARLSAEAQVPALLVDMLARMLRYRSFASLPAKSPELRQPTFRNYVPIMRHAATVRIVDVAVAGLLRAINVLTASELLSLRLAADLRLLPLLFESIRCVDAVEVALALIEEALHASRRATDFDLSSIPSLSELVESLTPFQLGSFCRVLAPLVDERDVPLCGGDHCSGACALPSVSPQHDWQQIESSAKQLRARRSYVRAKDRVVRDRNHAVLLAIPGLLQKLVTLVSVPPAPREELVLVDHALRNGVFTLNFDLGDVTVDSPHFNAQHGTLFASIRADLEPGGEVVFHHVGAGTPQGDGNNGAPQPPLSPEEEVRQRVMLMVFRRLTNMDNEEADQTGTDNWDLLKRRISRAKADYSKGVRENGIFRERRRQVRTQGFRVGVLQVGDGGTANESVVAVSGVQVETEGGEQATENEHVGDGLGSSVGEQEGFTTTRGGGPSLANALDNHDSDSTSPQMSINGLLMASHQVEVLFVLYSFLIGRRKSEVQRCLVDYDIFSVLARFCDALDWGQSSNGIKTEESLKVHFIRLLHYMCDGSEEETLLTSRIDLLFADHERELLKSIADGQIPELVGFGSSISTPVSPCAQEPMLLAMQSLSLNSCLCPRNLSASHSVHREIEANGAHLHCCPHRRHNLSRFRDENIRTDACMFNATEDSAIDEDISSCGTSSPKRDRRGFPMPERVRHDFPIDAQPGIICKVAEILIQTSGQEEEESTRRYLLSGCIETFLRTASVPEKTLLAYQGLLVHLLRQLSESTNMTSHVSQFRQTSFDLLGQLVKWNRDLFKCMNEVFRRDPKLLPLLLRAVSDRLIDSNVFVRSIVMSLEKFRAEDELGRIVQGHGDGYIPYDFQNCLLWEFVETYRTQLIHDLLSSVRVEDVNFENICCVNTTLILLVTSCLDEDALDMTLGKIADMVLETIARRMPRRQSLFDLDPIDIFDNFDRLVEFWMSYYQYQGLDVASQEISSNIHFDRLVAMATWLHDRLPLISDKVIAEAAMIPRE